MAPLAIPKSYLVNHFKNCVIVKLSPNLDPQDAKTVDQIVFKSIQPHTDTIIIDCENLKQISKTWVNGLNNVAALAKRSKLKLLLSGATPEFVEILKFQGFEKLTPIKESIKQGLVDSNQLSTPADTVTAVDNTFVNALKESSLFVLKIQFSTEFSIEGTRTESGPPTESFEFATAVKLQSKAIPGWLILRFSMGTLVRLRAKYLKKPSGSDIRVSDDLAKELMNLIFARARGNLKPFGLSFESSCLPILMKDYTVKFNEFNSRPRVVLPMKSELGVIQLEVCPDDSKLIQTTT